MSKHEHWLYTISSEHKWFDLNLRETWRYRDLLLLFVRRDIVTAYKQTILGPLWFLVQPLFTSLVFTLVFNNLGQIQTDGVPPFLFNLAGITAWTYFKECLTNTSNTFRANQNIFGKVYFPRVIVPLSKVVANLFKFGIQLFIFILFYLFFVYHGYELSPSLNLLLMPLYLFLMASLGLGLGMIITAMTTKYRDLTVLVGFATSLLMYLSAVPYPLSEARLKFPEWLIPFVEFNPLSQMIEGFRYMLLGEGSFSLWALMYTCGISLVIFLMGLLLFNRTEKRFIDTV
ncbi:ABC transporter permease [Winogradskyella aurantiaca]|uniref:ABC transporter permease n=1 Tax=Winogradskyella aurantiaca TaxID=2219558 RepID=UPI000E1D39B5|nr:ABC transporter permease [Winogradskyella aurantiaca]